MHTYDAHRRDYPWVVSDLGFRVWSLGDYKITHTAHWRDHATERMRTRRNRHLHDNMRMLDSSWSSSFNACRHGSLSPLIRVPIFTWFDRFQDPRSVFRYPDVCISTEGQRLNVSRMMSECRFHKIIRIRNLLSRVQVATEKSPHLPPARGPP